MRIIALTVCLFFAGSTACFAYGAIALGFEYNLYEATSSVNQTSKADAERAALGACRTAKYRNCSIFITFENTCAAVFAGSGFPPPLYGGTDTGSVSKALDNALLACSRAGNGSCYMPLRTGGGVCDRTPGTSTRNFPSEPVVNSSDKSTTISTTTTPSSSNIDGISGFIFFVGIIGLAFYWLYWRWTSKELPVEKLISAEETARDRAELKLLQEQAQLPKLPPPVLPERLPSPVTGIMRVDVTQTEKTVDVFVVLSEQSKFIVEKHDLANIPIEENIDGLQAHLKEHMMRYSDDYDTDTKIGIQDTVEYRNPNTQAMHEQVMEQANRQYRAEREAEKKYKLREEQEREAKYYTATHTVLLGQYLTNPYRKVVANRLEANQYLARLEKEYLPKIKALLESAPAQGQKSYDF